MSEKNEDQTSRPSGSRIIGRILPGAVKLWLRSQLEEVADLAISLEGRDRQIISGYLPGVSVAARSAVYRGIHISDLQLSAQDIRINVGQVIRGRPLRLLKVFPVMGGVKLSAEDLNASLDSELLGEGLRDFWRQLVKVPAMAESIDARYGSLPLQTDVALQNAQIQLGDGCLGLSFYPQAEGETAVSPVVLGTELTVVDGNQLCLENSRWLETLAEVTDLDKGEPIDALQGFQWDLGSDTQLSELTLQPSQLLCCGQLMVNP